MGGGGGGGSNGKDPKDVSKSFRIVLSSPTTVFSR